MDAVVTTVSSIGLPIRYPFFCVTIASKSPPPDHEVFYLTGFGTILVFSERLVVIVWQKDISYASPVFFLSNAFFKSQKISHYVQRRVSASTL